MRKVRGLSQENIKAVFLIKDYLIHLKENKLQETCEVVNKKLEGRLREVEIRDLIPNDTNEFLFKWIPRFKVLNHIQQMDTDIANLNMSYFYKRLDRYCDCELFEVKRVLQSGRKNLDVFLRYNPVKFEQAIKNLGIMFG